MILSVVLRAYRGNESVRVILLIGVIVGVILTVSFVLVLNIYSCNFSSVEFVHGIATECHGGCLLVLLVECDLPGNFAFVHKSI